MLAKITSSIPYLELHNSPDQIIETRKLYNSRKMCAICNSTQLTINVQAFIQAVQLMSIFEQRWML